MIDETGPIPPPPEFEPELVQRCRDHRNAIPIVFEWYRYSAQVALVAASILPEAPGLREFPRQHYVLLTGLLLRCAQLMRASLELASKDRFGDAIRILTRSICESSVRLLWLCQQPDSERFRRYVADGLKAELELKQEVERNVAARGSVLPIEARILDSIDRFIRVSGLPEDEIVAAKKLTDVASMYEAAAGGRPLYLVIQKLGSHATHGTWLDVWSSYVDMDDAETPALRYDQIPPSEDHLRITALMVLDATRIFTRLVHPPEETSVYILERTQIAENGLMATMDISYPDDFVEP